ncbi:MAG: GNAT family N-acetyltransferase, partial [Pseudoalteromonas sp.]
MSEIIEIRDARPSDSKTILHFINELAIYEKEPDAVKTNEQAILDTLFSEGATAHS